MNKEGDSFELTEEQIKIIAIRGRKSEIIKLAIHFSRNSPKESFGQSDRPAERGELSLMQPFDNVIEFDALSIIAVWHCKKTKMLSLRCGAKIVGIVL